MDITIRRSRLDLVKVLLDRGAGVNEDPAYRFGRTAPQAATSQDEPYIELIKFLLERGADINAKPATYGGATVLQGAAICDDLVLAKMLIQKGAQVNADSAYTEGRYAIEGAAENGRLDMVQLLLNASTVGNMRNGTGLQEAISLAQKNEHFAIVGLLTDAVASGTQNGSGGVL